MKNKLLNLDRFNLLHIINQLKLNYDYDASHSDLVNILLNAMEDFDLDHEDMDELIYNASIDQAECSRLLDSDEYIPELRTDDELYDEDDNQDWDYDDAPWRY